MDRGWVALTGTPGVGKTTVARELAYRGVRRIDLAEFAKEHELTEGRDRARDSLIIDPERVGPEIAMVAQRDERLLLDAHWSHDVPGIVGAVVLRLHPTALRERLAGRGWPAAKVQENVEAEAMDLILQEAVQRLGVDRVCELDATGRAALDVARDVHRILRDPAVAAARRPGQVDWSGTLLGTG